MVNICAFQVVPRDVSKSFGMVLHACLLHIRRSYRNCIGFFGLLFHFGVRNSFLFFSINILRKRILLLLEGAQSSRICPTLFLL